MHSPLVTENEQEYNKRMSNAAHESPQCAISSHEKRNENQIKKRRSFYWHMLGDERRWVVIIEKKKKIDQTVEGQC